MNPSNRPSPVQIAEAAAWVAHLHGAQRTTDSERGLRIWLEESPAHKYAWEVATEEWENVGNLQGAAMARAIPSIFERARPQPRSTFRYLAAAAALVALSVGVFSWLQPDGISTKVGEQRIVALEDGTRVTLNTASRIVVRYDDRVRQVELKSGEARFDVARQAERPFFVTAGDRRVRALGTSFVVRHETGRTAITLVEGKVSVSENDGASGRSPALVKAHASANARMSANARASANAAAEEAGTPAANARSVVLVPGQRMTFVSGGAPIIDTPTIEKVTAWQRGQVIMDGMRLGDAIAEMNRYSADKLVMSYPNADGLMISGVFQSGDSLSFANAVARTYQLQVVESGEEILLAGDPRAAY